MEGKEGGKARTENREDQEVIMAKTLPGELATSERDEGGRLVLLPLRVFVSGSVGWIRRSLRRFGSAKVFRSTELKAKTAIMANMGVAGKGCASPPSRWVFCLIIRRAGRGWLAVRGSFRKGTMLPGVGHIPPIRRGLGVLG